MGKTFLPSNRLANRLFAVATALMFFALMPTAHGASATQASAGRGHTCAVTSSGGVQCWGWNAYGQLGDGTTIDRVTPVAVSGLASGVASVAAGIAHSCALMVAGGLKCWGQNFNGELGDGTTTNRNAPVDVLTLSSGVSALASGSNSTCAVLTAGGVSCWGYNALGQLGDGTLVNRSSPVPVVGLGSAAIAVGLGAFHTCAVLTGGAVKCWGYGMDGQIGDGLVATTPRPAPVDVVGLSTGVTRLALGAYHSCALLASGGVKCWGYNGLGSLGDGTTTQRRAPVDVAGLASGVTSIAATADGYHTCAVLVGGALRCWGSNTLGQLGNGDFSTQASPVTVTAIGTSVSSIALGTNHTCAIIAGSGGVACWGSNALGQIGDGGGTNVSLPQDVIGLTAGVQTLSNGGEHACAVTTAGGAKCWGRNDFGQLGNGLTALSSVSVDVSGLTSGVAQVTAGSLNSCALTTAGGVKCWGLGTSGQLGNSGSVNQLAPVNVTGLASGVAAIVSKGNHTCALLTSGGIKCWGSGGSGQLGEGATLSRSSPVDVTGLSSGVSAISAGLNHTCAVLSAGGTKCWGFNSSGQLGINSTVNSTVPADAVGLSAGSVRVGGGSNHSCGVNSAGALLCWGRNLNGQIGDGTTLDRPVPTAVPGLSGGIATSTGGTAHSCALRSTGVASCWGDGGRGQLGRGSFFGNVLPSVTTVGTYAVLSAGGDTTCAVTTAGGAKCWGNNNYGQLGSGATSVRLTPATTVVGFAASVTTVAATPSPSLLGQVVTIRATVVGAAPTGSVNFKDGGVSISGCASVAMSGGAAVCTTSALALGTRSLQAEYSGDVNNPASVSPATTHLVNPLPATVAITSSTNPSIAAQAVSFTATVGGAVAPTSSVSFYDGTQLIAGCASVALSGGNPATAICGSVSALAVGDHVIAAVYAGDNNVAAASALTQHRVTPSASTVAPMLAVGSRHNCTLSALGAVQCWGENESGQLGDGSTTAKATPVAVNGLQSGVRSVAAGRAHSCALLQSGAVQCWGNNARGQLGNGGTTDVSTAVAVVGLGDVATSVVTGADHTCAVLASGGVKCWGDNDNGSLGNNDPLLIASPLPVAVSGLASGIVMLAGGYRNNCVLLDTGRAKCWGFGSDGRIGDGSGGAARIVPSDVVAQPAAMVKIVTGGGQSCALLVTGEARCWGGNNRGQVGDGTTIQRNVPTPVSGLASPVKDIAVGSGSFTCAVLASGQPKCWGRNVVGQLGDGTVLQRITPTAVVGLTSGVLSIGLGDLHTCAMTAGNAVRCWGDFGRGKLGDGSVGYRTPPGASVASGALAQVGVGDVQACATTTTGGVVCWGRSLASQLDTGLADGGQDATPVPMPGLASGVARVEGGSAFTCAISTAGGLKCWGVNTWGQLGDGTTTNRSVPTDVIGLTSGVAAVSLGTDHGCALTTVGGVKCWGYNGTGALGNGTTISSFSPVDVTSLSFGVLAISVNDQRSCAVLTGGALRCWGDNAQGQLGDGTTTNRLAPTLVSGLSSGVAAVAAGDSAVCALMSTGGVKCWGSNLLGEVGNGTFSSPQLAPVDVSGLASGVLAIVSGAQHSCAQLTGGGVTCWGANRSGQIGDGTILARNVPTSVSGFTSGVTALSLKAFTTCALMTGGAAKCWGLNGFSQMGDGSVPYRSTAGTYVAQNTLLRPLNVSDSASVTAAVDGAMIARYLAGMTGSALGQGLNTAGALRTDSAELSLYLNRIRPLLDIDGNNEFNPLTDGLLLIRYLQGLRGGALIAGAVGSGASRFSAVDIEAYLGGLLP